MLVSAATTPRGLSRTRFLGAAAAGLGLLGTAGARSAAAGITRANSGASGQAAGSELLGLFRTAQQLVTAPVPLDRGLVNATDTPQIVTHAVGPIDLRAGDLVLLTAHEEFTNPNARAADPYRVAGSPSEHWSLWVMAALGVQRGTSIDPSLGTWVRSQNAQNWNGQIHHQTVDVTEWDVVPYDMPAAYYYTVCYFASSPAYRLPGAQVIIEASQYGGLTAAVFRSGS